MDDGRRITFSSYQECEKGGFKYGQVDMIEDRGVNVTDNNPRNKRMR